MELLAILYIIGSLALGYQEYLDERQLGTEKREAILRGLLIAVAWVPLRIFEAWRYSR